MSDAQLRPWVAGEFIEPIVVADELRADGHAYHVSIKRDACREVADGQPNVEQHLGLGFVHTNHSYCILEQSRTRSAAGIVDGGVDRSTNTLQEVLAVDKEECAVGAVHEQSG